MQPLINCAAPPATHWADSRSRRRPRSSLARRSSWLLREAGLRVVNVAITQGSRKDRQQARLEELRNACGYLGFEVVPTAPGGLEKVNPKARGTDPAAWAKSVAIVAEIIRRYSPQIAVFPHDADWNSTHIGTHLLVTDALRQLGAAYACATVETEFWAPLDDPNCMLECSATDIADLMAATSFHVGEVQRNPYHLRLPAWMIDNVRRGGELVGGQGAAVPDFTFATLYRVRRWNGSGFEDIWSQGRMIAAAESITRFPG